MWGRLYHLVVVVVVVVVRSSLVEEAEEEEEGRLQSPSNPIMTFVMYLKSSLRDCASNRSFFDRMAWIR